MEYVGGQDNNQNTADMYRFSYIQNIVRQLGANPHLLATSVQERLYGEALGRLVNMANKFEPCAPSAVITHIDEVACRHIRSRRSECLIEILNLLLNMERQRLYDPPTDDEINYYLLIKKYVRCICIFFDVHSVHSVHLLGEQVDGKYKYFTPFSVVCHVEELAEFNCHLADLANFVSEMDIKDGSAIKPFMGMKENYEMPSVIDGSRNRTHQFYWHKFMLALTDLRSSEFAVCPPSAEEKRCYLQMLDSCASESVRLTAAMDMMYREPLYKAFLKRFKCEIIDVKRHWESIKRSILKKLSSAICWESLAELGDAPDWREYLLEFSIILDTSGSLCNEKLAAYISLVDRCIHIVGIMHVFIKDIDAKHSNPPWGCNYDDVAFEALHSLTLMKCGSSSGGYVFQDSVILQNSSKLESGELHHEKSKGKCKLDSSMELKENENLKILSGIVEDLRWVGDSNEPLDREESLLIAKLWQNVATSVHFFLCERAYEQKHYVMQEALNHKLLADILLVNSVGTEAQDNTLQKEASEAPDDTLQEKDLVYNLLDNLRLDINHIFTNLQFLEKELRRKLSRCRDGCQYVITIVD